MRKNASGNGSIRKKVITRNGKKYTYWEGRYTAGRHPGTGKQIQRSVTGKTQKEVAEKLKAIRQENTEAFVDYKNLTVSGWLDIWMREYVSTHTKPTTTLTYSRLIEYHIKPNLGAIKLCNLQPHHIQTAVNSIHRSGMAPSTVRMCGAVISCAMNQAEKNGFFAQSPYRGINYPPKDSTEIHALNQQQTREFLTVIAGGRYEYPLKTMLFLGLRISELVGLRWKCVDFEKSIITVDSQLKRISGQMVTMTPKSGKPRKIIAPQFIMDLLRDQRKRYLKTKLKHADIWQENDLVFVNDDGTPLSEVSIRKSTHDYGAAIGVPGLHPHDLRHSYAVASLLAGVDIKTVQENLGHATSTFTMDVYAHATDEMKRIASDKLNDYIQLVK